MYLQELNLRNFRLFPQYKGTFTPGINIILGENAVGKTSLLESIYFLGFCKSHRTSNYLEVIKNGLSDAAISAVFIDDDKKNKIVIGLTKENKRILVNSKQCKNLSEYIGMINIVSFSPDDLDIVSGSPGERRRFIDVNLSQIDKNYLQGLINYRKILRQRNELLKNFRGQSSSDLELLKVITKQLIEISKIIIKKRSEFIKKLEPFVVEKVNFISSEKGTVRIIYLPNLNYENVEKEMMNHIETDIGAKTTTVGPHRDELIIINQGKDVKRYGSQGQQRTSVLGLKLGLAEMLNKMDKKLIILLDDVFSELDFTRQNQLVKALNNPNQIFITTTSIEGINQELVGKSNIITLRKETKI